MKFENQYLTFDEFVGLGGNMEIMPFNLLEYEIEKKIDELTFDRFRKTTVYPKELKLCIYNLINDSNADDNSNIVSETIGNYSIQKRSKEEIEKNRKKIIKQYLSKVKVDGVFVLYPGADVNDY